MRRTIFAIVLGLAFPVITFMSLGFIGYFVSLYPLTDIRINGEIAPGILFAPFSIPIYIEILLRQNGLLPQTFAVSRFWYGLAFLIIFDWALYGSIFYFLLGRLKRFKKQPAFSETPPAPPEFEHED